MLTMVCCCLLMPWVSARPPTKHSDFPLPTRTARGRQPARLLQPALPLALSPPSTAPPLQAFPPQLLQAVLALVLPPL